MKKIILVLSIIITAFSCGELDYDEKEYYEQSLYIISHNSTSSKDRVIENVISYTFVDTMRVFDKYYNHDTILGDTITELEMVYKVGVGGSKTPQRDIEVTFAFDKDELNYINRTKGTNYYIPAIGDFTTNLEYNESTKQFSTRIKAGESSQKISFKFTLTKSNQDSLVNIAFPLKIVKSSAKIDKRYKNLTQAGLNVTLEYFKDFNGMPLPEIPEGRYISTQLLGNAAENTPAGEHLYYKFITKLTNKEEDKHKYMIWGTSAWSWETFGLHGGGWMYNTLNLNNKKEFTFTVAPILGGDPKFPAKTFNYSTTQNPTHKNKYDPFSKQLIIKYSNVIGQDYTDVLTFHDTIMTLRPSGAGHSPVSWEQVRNRGYKYRLPSDDDW